MVAAAPLVPRKIICGYVLTAVLVLILLAAPWFLSDAAGEGLQIQTTNLDHHHVHTNRNRPCCYHTEANFSEKFSPDMPSEYDAWKALASTPFGQALVQPDHPDCEIQWKRLVLDEADGWYLGRILEQYNNYEGSGAFPYREDRAGLPRILLLGDSISEGAWIQTVHMYGSLANIHVAPTNCGGFDKYATSLTTWLGDCPWDLIQFNVGVHFHPDDDTGFAPYQEQFRSVVARLREHSPAAKIVFALTTPTPFDSEDTWPDRATCPNYDKFHPEGFVHRMNDVARGVAADLGVTVNDRYSAILPYLGKYQFPCDIHYAMKGYRVLAKSDWKTFSALLSLSEEPSASICCYETKSDLGAMYNQKFFEDQKNASSAVWSGHEYEEWQDFVSTDLGRALVDPDPYDCKAQWRRLVLEESTGIHLKKYLTDLQNHGESADYPFLDFHAGKPRFLLLGDTITEGVSKQSRELFGDRANMHLAPMHPRTIQDYMETLPVWLGNCQWHLIQFDLGVHFQSEDESTLSLYRDHLRAILSRLQEHSPEAFIMISLSTPSPLDQNGTAEDMLCPQSNTTLHRAGFVNEMNRAVLEVTERSQKVLISDRYSAILPHLSEYQKPCDIHFTPDGYRILAETDGEEYRKLFPSFSDLRF